MRHVRAVSVGRSVRAQRADCKSDYLNALWRDTWDFVFCKKNEVSG